MYLFLPGVWDSAWLTNIMHHEGAEWTQTTQVFKPKARVQIGKD